MGCEKTKYIAHIREDGTVQTVLEHLIGTAALAEKYASSFEASEQGRLVGMAHDIGKYSKKYQNRILRNGPRVDHSTAGAYLCAVKNQCYSAFCVAGHHSGLPDRGERDDESEPTLFARINKAEKGLIPDYSAWKEEITELPNAMLPSFCQENPLSEMFFIRMLYSCLVDADYLDTEKFMKNEQIDRGDQTSMSVLEKKLDYYIDGWFPPKGELNQKRCEILQNCIDKHSLEQGVFTLTVPTGGGKTVASLAFAIKHARAWNLNRVIYVIPYTSIIEQTADVFRNILGEDYVLEHHSNVELEEYDTAKEEVLKRALATENWDMPIIVTTAVQFFESLFAYKSSRCRKLHNIAKSVIVFDEAQMIPLKYLKPCVYSMSELSKNYKVTTVLCTATQPSLEEIFKEFDSGFSSRELCPKLLQEDSIFKRIIIKDAGILSWDKVADYIIDRTQILCIVNSRKNAQILYDSIKGEGSFHLSTLMIPVERKRILKEIRTRLKNGKKCRVVSTSLIEAGVDVDFPEVIREQAGLDSILQAAGRCNREGKRGIEDSIVTIFKTEEKTPPLFSPNISACRNAMEKYEVISKSECIQYYYNQLYYLKGQKNLDGENLISLIQEGKCPFRKVSERFKLIDSDTCTVYIPLDEGEKLVGRIKKGEISRTLLRKLGQYSVNIYSGHLASLIEAGDVEKIGESEWALCNMSLYDEATGLSLAADTGKGIFV